MRQLRGQARADIAAFFEGRGFVEREIEKLRSRRSWKRARAAHLLGDMGSDRAVRPLLAALDDSKREVRAAAARSLGTLQCAEAVEPLVEALVHGRGGARRRRTGALVETAGGFSTATVAEDLELVVRLHRHLRERGRGVPDRLCPGPGRVDRGARGPALAARQRDRWQRGPGQALWVHRRMAGNPRYGPWARWRSPTSSCSSSSARSSSSSATPW